MSTRQRGWRALVNFARRYRILQSNTGDLAKLEVQFTGGASANLSAEVAMTMGAGESSIKIIGRGSA
jgi:hypothetical protein